MVVTLMRILMCFMAQEVSVISLNSTLYPVVIIFHCINGGSIKRISSYIKLFFNPLYAIHL